MKLSILLGLSIHHLKSEQGSIPIDTFQRYINGYKSVALPSRITTRNQKREEGMVDVVVQRGPGREKRVFLLTTSIVKDRNSNEYLI